MKILIVSVCIVSLILIVIGCGKRSENRTQSPTSGREAASSREIVVGGLYASRNEDGSYGVLKVLVVDDFAVHLRSYKNRFSEIPKNLDASVLSLGGIDDPDGFGVGHFPLAKEGFWNSEPVFLKQESVAEDELEGYRIYLDAMRQ